jgi:hypothetical protein
VRGETDRREMGMCMRSMRGKLELELELMRSQEEAPTLRGGSLKLKLKLKLAELRTRLASSCPMRPGRCAT